jgi:hypothetical protein
LKNARLRRCAASSVTAAYKKVRLIPSDLRALHPGIFEQPDNRHFSTIMQSAPEVGSAVTFV